MCSSDLKINIIFNRQRLCIITQKLKIKYLINIGIFSGIYFIVMFALDMMGIAPVMFLIYPFFNSIVSGVIVILWQKNIKFWYFLYS